MKKLLYKEFKLCTNIQIVIFTILSVLILIPSWPSLIPFIYPMIAVINIFPIAIANSDTLYTSLLPIRKKDVVKARVIYIFSIELFSLLISLPFAEIRKYVLIPLVGNSYPDLGVNLATYGILLFIFSIFNLVLIPWVYKRLEKLNLCYIVSTFLATTLVTAFMLLFIFVPKASTFINDYSSISSLLTQIGILISGILIFIGDFFLVNKLAGDNFNKLNI